MTKHITTHETIAQYEAVVASLARPQMAFIEENGGIYMLDVEHKTDVDIIGMYDAALYNPEEHLLWSTATFERYDEESESYVWNLNFYGLAVEFRSEERNIGVVTASDLTDDNFAIMMPDEETGGVVRVPLKYIFPKETFKMVGYSELSKVVVANSLQWHDTSNLDKNGHEYVDLGLPSGTLWAKYNVGATGGTTPESWYGKYIAWGETEEKTSETPYNWDNYKYGAYNNMTKYNTNADYGEVDNKITLDPEDDAARAQMGGDWKTPTCAHIAELYSFTDSEWIDNYGVEGLNGRLFTSRINGETLFIPAAGYCYGFSFNYAGSSCNLWTSSLYFACPSSACSCDFNSDGIWPFNDSQRCNGNSVRGIL